MPGLMPLRIACIGCGFIGRRHMENSVLMDGVTPAAFADANLPAAEAFLRDFGGAYATSSVERIFDDPAIDAVIIATHHDSHTPLALAAAGAGKHILIEKPLALTVDDCRRIARAATGAGVTLTVNFKFRFAPMVICARDAIARPIATHGQLTMPRMPGDIWVRDPVRGGGLILATACHVLDMVCWLNRSEPIRVYAESVPAQPTDGNVAAVAATLRFASGSIASLLLADAGENPHAGKWLHEMFDGSRSAVLYEHFRQLRLSGPDEYFAAEDEIRADGTWGVLEDFARAIRTGTPPAIGARDGLRATLLATRLLASLRSGAPQEVAIDDTD
ncbi:MAG: Gfo/Idh/MocA family oxidoreductase [Bryobacteraceae bacterium]